MKISKNIFSAILMLFMLPVLSSADNLIGVSGGASGGVSADTITNYYTYKIKIIGPAFVTPGLTYSYTAKYYKVAHLASGREVPIEDTLPSPYEWTCSSLFTTSVNQAFSINLTTPDSLGSSVGCSYLLKVEIPGYKDELWITVIGADIDIDSDNKYGLNVTPEEDRVEAGFDNLGKVICVNRDDAVVVLATQGDTEGIYQSELKVSDKNKVCLFDMDKKSIDLNEEGVKFYTGQSYTWGYSWQYIFVKAMAPGVVDITYVLRKKNESGQFVELASDTIKLTIVDFDLVSDKSEGAYGKLIPVKYHDYDINDETYQSLLRNDSSGIQLKTDGLPNDSKLILSLSDSLVANIRRDTGQTIGELELDKQMSVLSTPTTTDFIIEGLNPAAKVDFIATLKIPNGNGEYIELSDKVVFTTYEIKMITPAGDPVNDPKSTIGDGQNEFTFDDSTIGILNIGLNALVSPDGVAELIKDRCVFKVGEIENSELSWGEGLTYDTKHLYATAIFRGLPANYDAFGRKDAAIKDTGGRIYDTSSYEVFYDAHACNSPSASSPIEANWFVYYKQNAGGGDYGYDPRLKGDEEEPRCATAEPGGEDESISIGPGVFYPHTSDTYDYIKVNNVDKLKLTGETTDTYQYYTRFCMILAHERWHAYENFAGQSGPGTDDYDYDDITTEDENNKTGSDYWDAYSIARRSTEEYTHPVSQYQIPDPAYYYTDCEAYANSVVELRALAAGIDTSSDWAAPGSNHGNSMKGND